MAQSQRSRHKIEPLNYAEMASAPALKGMTSFLEISPEEFQTAQNRLIKNHKAPGDETHPGDDSGPADATFPTKSRAEVGRKRPPVKTWASRTAAVKTVPRPGELHSTPGDETYPGNAERPGGRKVGWTSSSSVALEPPTEQTKAALPLRLHPAHATGPDLTPGRGRSKVRRCVLAQDGHSLGEEAVYQVLWRAGRPESSDPNSSRTVRMGAAEVGNRINMAKKNVRMNISRLFEKLALEILENFETMNSQARLYRVFSFKQILERRRAAGLEYVLRNKGVVFCTAQGGEVLTSPAFVSTPGDETYRPAVPRPPRAIRERSRAQVLESMSATGDETPLEDADQTEATSEEIATVSKALNRYWAADERASFQLIQKCRTIRPDASATEIAFFAADKVELARQNTKILNPTGLVLATVPLCFQGETFEQFRRRRHGEQQRPEAVAKSVGDSWKATLLKIVQSPLTSEAQRARAQAELAMLA